MSAARSSEEEAVPSGGYDAPRTVPLTPRAQAAAEEAEGAGSPRVAVLPSDETGAKHEHSNDGNPDQPLAEVLTEWAIEGAKVRGDLVPLEISRFCSSLS